jgi:hypothetical protein
MRGDELRELMDGSYDSVVVAAPLRNRRPAVPAAD